MSILKPLKGLDEGLEENLESFFKLNYPHYELLFCVADENDPVVPIVEKLIAGFPNVSARLILSGTPIGPNPKVNNLFSAYHQAKFDAILISDSNIRVTADYLSQLTSQLKPDVGVLTSAVAGIHPRGLGGNLEATYLNTFYARWMQVAFFCGAPFVIGKSMLFRRSVANRFGGIHTLGRYVAEDYMTGQAMRRLGYRVALMPQPIPQYIGVYSAEQFWQRHVRWGRIRKSQAPVPFFLEPFMSSFLASAAGALAFHQIFSWSLLWFCLGQLSLWMLGDLLLYRRLSGTTPFSFLLFWILRESTNLWLWIHIAWGNTIEWRGKKYRVIEGGLLSDLPR